MAYVTNDSRQIKINVETVEKIKIFDFAASLGPATRGSVGVIVFHSKPTAADISHERRSKNVLVG